MMIYPRILARLWAWFAGYFWLPCPSCEKHFAGFEGAIGCGVIRGKKLLTVCLDCGAKQSKQYVETVFGPMRAVKRYQRDQVDARSTRAQEARIIHL